MADNNCPRTMNIFGSILILSDKLIKIFIETTKYGKYCPRKGNIIQSI